MSIIGIGGFDLWVFAATTGPERKVSRPQNRKFGWGRLHRYQRPFAAVPAAISLRHFLIIFDFSTVPRIAERHCRPGRILEIGMTTR